MRPTITRRRTRRPASREVATFKKDSQQEPLFFGGATPEPFFKPVVAMPQAQVQRKCANCESEEKLQRSADKEEEKVQRKEAGQTANTANTSINYLSNINSKGQPLHKSEQTFYENRIGADFSDVKIHTDTEAAVSASHINAQAYAYNNHIVFNKGKYQPHTSEGKHLLAHELAHVVQQTGAGRNHTIQRQEAPAPAEPVPVAPAPAAPVPVAPGAPAAEVPAPAVPAPAAPVAEVPVPAAPAVAPGAPAAVPGAPAPAGAAPVPAAAAPAPHFRDCVRSVTGRDDADAILSNALNRSIEFVNTALGLLANAPAAGTVYETALALHFGTPLSNRARLRLRTVYQRILGNLTVANFICNRTACTGRSTQAMWHPSDDLLHICPTFWQQANVTCQAIVIIHEAAHDAGIDLDDPATAAEEPHTDNRGERTYPVAGAPARRASRSRRANTPDAYAFFSAHVHNGADTPGDCFN